MNGKAAQKKAGTLKGTMLGLITIACLLIAAPQLAAQQSNEGQQQSQQGQQSQEMAQAKQQAQEYVRKLKEIQKSAIENNPELKEKRKEYQALQQKKMRQMVSENATRKEMMKAQMALRRDKELLQKRKALQEDFLEAMKNEDPKTQEYLDKLTQARKKIQEISRQRRQGQGQGQGQEKMQK